MYLLHLNVFDPWYGSSLMLFLAIQAVCGAMGSTKRACRRRFDPSIVLLHGFATRCDKRISSGGRSRRMASSNSGMENTLNASKPLLVDDHNLLAWNVMRSRTSFPEQMIRIYRYVGA